MKHDSLDSVIAISESKESFVRLIQAEVNVECFEYSMTHEICPKKVKEAGVSVLTELTGRLCLPC